GNSPRSEARGRLSKHAHWVSSPLRAHTTCQVLLVSIGEWTVSRAHAIAVMDQLAEQTWLELRHYYDSKIRIDEDAITSHLLFSIATRLKGTLLMQDGRKIERRTGAYFDLWVA